MRDLIERLEKATKGSDELDVEIAKFLGWVRNNDRAWINPEGTREYHCEPEHFRRTRSIDAALTLVPEGHSWQVSSNEFQDAAPACRAEVGFGPGVWATTPALALCIAALKAGRESSDD